MKSSTPASRRARKTNPSSLTTGRGRKAQDDGPARGVSTVRVAAIGASAGGLEAFLELISELPVDPGLALVLIQHLDPRHDSMLVNILAGATPMPVIEAIEGMEIERDQIYVIPPDTSMTIENNTLRLVPRKPKVPHRPLDVFFKSLAAARASDAIGVVLSGSNDDGTEGLTAIRDGGGTTFAQSPESAKFDVMPRAAAASADFVLAPAAIAASLMTITRGADSRGGDTPPRATAAELARVLDLLRDHHRVDFRHFKRASIERRILRRVLLGNYESLSAYADALESDRGAIDILYHDLLIGVTSFFREPGRFEALKTTVFPAITKNRGGEDSVRLWVAGCSTGEEVYSLGMSLLEYLGEKRGSLRIAIYGTDINEVSLAKARAAIYSQHDLIGVTPERLERFFTPANGGYRISKALRELCVFASHDVTRDPPYSRIDLVTCCNVLIYFDRNLQKKAVELLEYALAPGGFLMLGSSENLRGTTNQLLPVSSKPLIYRKGLTPVSPSIIDVDPRTPPPRIATPASPSDGWRTRQGERADADEIFLAQHLAPCGVLVDEQMQIIRIRGDVAPFLKFEAGDAPFDLFRLVRHHEVLAELRPAVRRAFSQKVTVTRDGTLVVEEKARRRISFSVIPYGISTPGTDRAWIVFASMPASTARTTDATGSRTEVAGLRRALATAIGDREHLADEASAAAEEAQSSDEELRSTNEELETAKEELESVNEELSTLNDELRLRNTDLLRMNDDIENLLGAVEIPILFVGTDLTVRRFNVTAGLLLNLRSWAIGRPLHEAKSSLDITYLEKLVGAVIETAEPADVEVQDATGDWRLLRIRAYRTSAGEIDGAIVAVLDIDALKRSVIVAEEATRAADMLSQAGSLLAGSLDYETTLASLARLSTAAFSDWCAVELVNENDSIRHLTVSHTNPVLRDLVMQFQQEAFSEPEHAPGAPQALRLRKSVLLTDLAKAGLTGIQPEAKIAQLIGALGVRSLISVPLIVRDKVLGTMTFSSSRRQYDLADLKLAEDLSQRAAIAIDTAMLFREAEAAGRYKDAFLGSVAHELRTPLTAIVGWVQLAQHSPDLTTEALVRVDESASLMRMFIEDLLDVTRIREQKLSVRMDEIDLVDVIRSSLQLTAALAKENGLSIRLNLELDPAHIRGDRVRLAQVVWNLLSNALKFTPPDGEIEIRVERVGDMAQLSVIDTGIGIGPEFLPHAFSLYRQENVARHTKGLGIGLAIVAQIVTLHGGTVRVESRGTGQGSTFRVTLPLAPPSAPGSEESSRSRRSGTPRRAVVKRTTTSKAKDPS
jgi:two-component system, chemotaxis family, CheB/CheR fusion protein